MNIRSNLLSLNRRAVYMAVPVLVLSMASTLVNAQEIYRGTMKLPVTAHWGNVVLTPGPYTISIKTIPSGARLVSILGAGTTQVLLAGPVASAEKSDRSWLTLVSVGGTYAVKRLDAGSLGNSFTFLVPKRLHKENLSASTAVESTVEVTGSR